MRRGAPEYVRVEIDGAQYEMTPEGKASRYVEGVLYQFKVDGLCLGPAQTPFFCF